MNNRHPWQLKKIKILGAVLKLPVKQHRQLSLFPIFMMNRLNWQCCSASSSKTVPRIWIFFSWYGCKLFIWGKKHWDPRARIFKYNNLSLATVHERISWSVLIQTAKEKQIIIHYISIKEMNMASLINSDATNLIFQNGHE